MNSPIHNTSFPARRALTTDALLARANQVFGDSVISSEWVNTPVRSLGGRKPLEMWQGTLDDQQEIFTILGRIEHGIF